MDDCFNICKIKAYAEININGENLELEYITKLLGLNIDYIRKQGDYKTGIKKGVEISPAIKNVNFSSWTYKTEEKGTYDISIQIGELIDVFKNKIKELRKIRRKYNKCNIDVCIVIYNHQRLLPAITISADQIAFLKNINVGISFDIYHNLIDAE